MELDLKFQMARLQAFCRHDALAYYAYLCGNAKAKTQALDFAEAYLMGREL